MFHVLVRRESLVSAGTLFVLLLFRKMDCDLLLAAEMGLFSFGIGPIARTSLLSSWSLLLSVERATVRGPAKGVGVKVAVSHSGTCVTAGTWAGDIFFWEDGGAASEGRLVRMASTRPLENYGELPWIVYKDDELPVVFFFSYPASFEIWDLSTKSISTSRRKLDGLEYLQTEAITSVPVHGEKIEEDGIAISQAQFFVAGDLEDGERNGLLEFDSLNMGRCVARYEVEARAFGASYVTIGGDRRADAGCIDGSLLLLDVSGRPASIVRGMPYPVDDQEVVPASLDVEDAGVPVFFKRLCCYYNA